MDPGNRVIADEPAETYYRRNAEIANHSGLAIINKKSPAHYIHWVRHPEDDADTEAFAFGRAFHCATLEPAVFDRTYVILPSDAPKYPMKRQWDAKNPSPESRRQMAWWEDFQGRNASKTVVSAADYDRARRMAQSIHNHSDEVAGLLVGGKREATLRWTDQETGMQCKARLDNWVPREFILDLKKTRDASPDAFSRSITNYLYDQQAAHYYDGAVVCDGAVQRYIILACEDVPPYVCQPYFLDPMAEERGWNLRQRALRKQAECLRTGRWPGYGKSFMQISLPSYAYFNIENSP